MKLLVVIILLASAMMVSGIKPYTYESKHCDIDALPLGCNSLTRGSVLRCLDANHKYRCVADNKWKKIV